MAIIDFRSDTVAMPSPEMRQAMVTSPLGDDVFGDDPTTNRLMEVAADRMGKEAATFVPSGTMGNLIGIAVNAHRGEELIADADSHAFYYETAGAAAVCGVQIRPVETEAGVRPSRSSVPCGLATTRTSPSARRSRSRTPTTATGGSCGH